VYKEQNYVPFSLSHRFVKIIKKAHKSGVKYEIKFDLYKQESLANAKVSARQPWYKLTGHNSLNH